MYVHSLGYVSRNSTYEIKVNCRTNLAHDIHVMATNTRDSENLKKHQKTSKNLLHVIILILANS